VTLKGLSVEFTLRVVILLEKTLEKKDNTLLLFSHPLLAMLRKLRTTPRVINNMVSSSSSEKPSFLI